MQATTDLEDIDARRRKEFKNYELEKEHLRRQELEELDKAKRAEMERKHNEMRKKHADHPKLHHPVCLPASQSISNVSQWCRHCKDH